MDSSITEFLWEEHPKTLVFLFGLLLIFSIILFYFDHAPITRATESSEATITEIRERHFHRIGVHLCVSYIFIVKEKEVKGAQLAWLFKKKTWEKKYKVGDRVQIWYNPEDPQESYLEKSHMIWPFIIGIFALGGIVVGIVREKQLRRWRKEQV